MKEVSPTSNKYCIHSLRPLLIAFWRDDKLQQTASLLVEQVPVCIRLGVADGKTTLLTCLGALAEAVNDDALLKSINLNVLMCTRSEDVRLRIFALTCSEGLWRAHGGKLLGKLNGSMHLLVPTHSIGRLCGRNYSVHCRMCGR